MAKKAAAGRIRIKQIRSGNGRPTLHRRTLRALGITRNQRSVVQNDTPAIRGMIRQVIHMVEVTPVED